MDIQKNKNLYLYCSGGVSSLILSRKMTKLINSRGLNISVCSFTISELKDSGRYADIILLTPPIRYRASRIISMFPSKLVYIVGRMDYSKLDAQSILQGALQHWSCRYPQPATP